MPQPYSKLQDSEPDLLGNDFIQPDEPIPTDSTPPFTAPLNPSQPPPTQPTASSSSQSQPSGKSHMFQMNFYRHYFDLDSDVFFQKIQKSLNPFARLDETEAYPNELYGFVWITGTLIFLMFVSSTGSHLLNQWIRGSPEEPYSYDFELLIKSISLFYGYNFIVPALLWAITTYYNKFPEPLSLTRTVSIYGYTNVLWIPITLINVVIVVFVNNTKHGYVLNILEWTIVGISGIITGLSNFNKLGPIIKKNCLMLSEAGGKSYYIIVGILAVVHLFFTVVVKISFFGIKGENLN
ncbi:Protein YIPF1 [Candida viswanathii]|uniref:Protein YIPF1 n=1 Tax=Candida viswanathii TaxID=5486 RepID=A0A367YBA7_9ASCO|nr:Protein YIPF1 [Candida viswanathii]